MLFATWAIHLRYALIILLLVVIIILMSKWTGSGSSGGSTVITLRPAAEKLVAMSHDALAAVETAPSPTDALVHTAYADAYLAAAEAVAPEHAKALQLAGLRHKVRAAQHAVVGAPGGE